MPSISVSPRYIRKSNDMQEEDEYQTFVKLSKLDEKMIQAKERSNKIISDRVKLEENRSKTVTKVRSDVIKREKEYSEKMILNLIEKNEIILKSKNKRSETLNQRKLKKNEIFFSGTDKSHNISRLSLSDIEKGLEEKEKKVKRNLEEIKNRKDFNASLKKEKMHLNFLDQLERREFQRKLSKETKTKIILKHLQMNKVIDLKKSYINKFSEESREKGYQFSQKCAKNKSLAQKEMQELELKHPFLTLSE